MNYNYPNSSYTCANQCVFKQENNVMCAHKNSYTLHIQTCVHKCLHHLLLLHIAIIKMSLSCLRKLGWFPCPRIPMHVSFNFLHHSIDWSPFHLSPLSSIFPHWFLISSLQSFPWLLSWSPFLFSNSLFDSHHLLIKLNDYN